MDDLVELENVVEMYSVSHNDYVLVVTPLLPIQADNHRQSELSMHMGSGARFCSFRQIKNPNPPLRKNASAKSRKDFETRQTKYFDRVNHLHPLRSKGRLRQVAAIDNAAELKKIADTESCTKNGSEELLRLNAYDPTKDGPIEILHTLPLGLAKFLVPFLWKDVLTRETDKKKSIHYYVSQHSNIAARYLQFGSLIATRSTC